MKGKWPLVLTTLLLILGGIPVLPEAGEPTEHIQGTTDKIISILSDPLLKRPEKAAERKRLVSATVDERFDWEEMARRSLARHWAPRTPDEKKEFVKLFRDLLERTYLDKVDDYSGEKVLYEGDTIDGAYAVVKVKIVTAKSKEIPVEYRVKKKGINWLVYDISIEGVSLVNNYRAQFNSILTQSPFSELVKRLKDKTVTGEKK